MPTRTPPERKMLTLYGDRAWQPDNPGYTSDSMVRGYDGLNATLQFMLRQNPKVTVLSFSYSHLVRPFSQAQEMLRIFLTILYTGGFQNMEHLATFGEDEGQPHMFLAGRGTMIRVQL